MKVVFIENGEVVAERNIPYPPNLPQNEQSVYEWMIENWEAWEAFPSPLPGMLQAGLLDIRIENNKEE